LRIKNKEKKIDDKPHRGSFGSRIFGLQKEAAAQSLTYMAAAFGLVAALAWNEAIRTAINHFLGGEKTVISLFVYAIIVTALAVFVTARISRLSKKIKEENLNNN
jgi:hypothetical protein